MANTFTQLVTDSFLQANENPLSSGGNWTTTTTGVFVPAEVVSHQVTNTALSGSIYNAGWYTGASFPSDQYSEITVSAAVLATSFTITYVRATVGVDTDYNLIIGGPVGATARVFLVKRVTGTQTVLVGPVTITLTLGDVFRLAVIGTTLSAFQNGVAIAGMSAVTDAVISSGIPALSVQTQTTNNDAEISKFAAGSVFAGTVVSVGLVPSTVAYPTTSTGTVTLSAPAPTGGIVVSLSSGTPSVATVPATVTVLAGQTTATFTVTSQNVSSQGTSLITASIGGGSSASATVTINPQTFSISGNAGTGSAQVSYSGTASGSVTADGSGNYTISGLTNGSYTITPSMSNFTFSPPSQNETISGANITGVNFTATPSGSAYSVPDSRVSPFGPNNSINVNGTLTYTQTPNCSLRWWFDTSFNHTQCLPEDCRAAGAPVASGTYPQNSRVKGG